MVKEPYWFSPARHQSKIDTESRVMIQNSAITKLEADNESFKQRCSDFVAFFNSLSSLQLRHTPAIGIDSDGRYPAFSRAIFVLKTYARYPFTNNGSFSSHNHIEETIRLVTLLHIAVLWRDSMLSGNQDDMDELNAALQAKEPHWEQSIEALLIIVLSGTKHHVTHPLKSMLVIQLMDVVRLLDLSSWIRVKVTLFEAFAGSPIDQLQDFRWDAELLYNELRHRY